MDDDQSPIEDGAPVRGQDEANRKWLLRGWVILAGAMISWFVVGAVLWLAWKRAEQ